MVAELAICACWERSDQRIWPRRRRNSERSLRAVLGGRRCPNARFIVAMVILCYLTIGLAGTTA